MEKFKNELSEILTELIGYPLLPQNIVSDDPGFYYYIRNLQPRHPICVMDYHVAPLGRPQLLLVLPCADYRRAEEGRIFAAEYADTSSFSFGYYWGGGTIYGVYWQPLEQGTGIKNTDRIRRYLWQMACRTYRHSLGHEVPQKLCADCPLEAEACLYSPLNQSGTRVCEFVELDRRQELRDALADRVKNELGFEVYDFMSHTGAKNMVQLYAGYRPGTVRIFASQELLNEMLYYPEVERDFAKLASSLRLIRKRRDSDISAEIDPEMDNQHQSCLTFWGDEMPTM